MSRFQSLFSIVVAVGALTVTALPVRGAFVAMQYYGIQTPNVRGSVQVERPRNPDAASKVYIALAGLRPGSQYRLSFTSDSCGTPPGMTDELAGRSLTANAVGAAFMGTAIDIYDNLGFVDTRSIRLSGDTGAYYFCQNTLSAGPAGNGDADGASAHFAKGGFRGTVRVHRVAAGRIDMVVSLGKLGVSTRYQIVHSPLTCSQFHEGDPDQPIVIGGFRSNAKGLGVYEREQDADVVGATSRGSYRIVERGSSATWGCSNITRFVEG